MNSRDSTVAAILAAAMAPNDAPMMTPILSAVRQCPHCGRADPTLNMAWQSSDTGNPRGDGGRRSKWAAYACSGCGGMLLAKGVEDVVDVPTVPAIIETFPAARAASNLLPAAARRFLQQAIEVLHAPDAAAVMAGSAVDAMLKAKGYEQGSLYDRIDKALADHLLTQGMADWAHSVRLGSNRPRHADADAPHVSDDEAERSVDFAEALGNFLFVLSAQIANAVRKVNKPRPAKQNGDNDQTSSPA